MKMPYWLVGCIFLLVFLFLNSCKSVHHEVLINSNPKTVWTVIMDTREYPKWNTMVRLVEGNVVEENKVKYVLKIDENKELEINAIVNRLIPEKLLNQKGGNPLVFSFNHTYKIEKKGDLVKVTVHEYYRGVGVIFWNTKPIQESYQILNNALKERCENLSQPT